MAYLIRTPWWLKKIYPGAVWKGDDSNKLYLTFDDGPHPEITLFVLDQLRQYDFKATFFCIGKNVEAHPNIYRQLLENGHRTGNHTHNHLNGWKSKDRIYLDNIGEAQKYIDSNLFRPPYGRITNFQLRQLNGERFKMKCIMWNLLSGDFDVKLTPEKCLERLIVSVKPGDIVVFHDSEKAFPRLKYALPRFLDHCRQKGYNPEVIP